MPPLTFFCARTFLICCLFRPTRGANHRGENMFVVPLFSLSRSFWFSVSPALLCFSSFLFPLRLCSCFAAVLKLRWNLSVSASSAVVVFCLRAAVVVLFIPRYVLSVVIHLSPLLPFFVDSSPFLFFSPPRLEDLLVPRSSHCLCPSSSLFLSLICVFLLAVSVLSFGLPSLFGFFSAPRLKDHSCRLFVVFTQRVFPLVPRHMLLVWRLGSNELTRRASLMCSGGIC